MTTEFVAPQKVGYTIAGCSSYSANYKPENILVDNPADQTSRWSGVPQTSSNSFKAKQWILLKLDVLAVVKSITLGKFNKPHPCNLREFKVYAGFAPNNMVEVLHAGLKNDSVPETFSVKYRNNEGVAFPSHYIKLVPISAQGQSYNTSIWFVSLMGIVNEQFVRRVYAEYSQYKEVLALRLLCKHLRARRLPYRNLLTRSGIQLEHPIMTQLYESLVLRGDFSEAEQLMEVAAYRDNLLHSYIYSSEPKAIWSRVLDTSAEGATPCPRAGHQMCLDEDRGLIYLYGGWNGSRNLGDFWVYSIKEGKWKAISENTEADGGPSGRSCHKMIYDSRTSWILLLGRLYDPNNGASGIPAAQDSRERDAGPELANDFWKYSTSGLEAGKWTLISPDTAMEGGPKLICDHNMVMDSDYGLLIVFGGKIITPESISKRESTRYSGLYFYTLMTNRWNLVFHDPRPNSPVARHYIPGRSGHSMIFDAQTRLLYIFAGQKQEANKTVFLSDMWTFSLVTQEITEVFGDYSTIGGPPPAFAQRATMDNETREFYALAGLTGSPIQNANTILAALWIYRIDYRQWIKVNCYANDTELGNPPATEDIAPRPRYAHGFVYDPAHNRLYLFGGNAGQDDEEKLNDFWYATLQRPSRNEILRKAKLLLRQQRFIEMCGSVPSMDALQYLQTQVSSVVNHSDEEEGKDFRNLLTHLLSSPPEPTPELRAIPTTTEDHSGDVATEAPSTGTKKGAYSPDETKLNSPPSSPILDTGTGPRSCEELGPATEAGPAIAGEPGEVSEARAAVEQATTGLSSSYPPSPDPGAPIAQATGLSFPPPPSPQTDDDIEMIGGAEESSGSPLPPSRRHEVAAAGLYTSTQIRNTMRRLSDVMPPMQPPPAPQLQHQTLPIIQRKTVRGPAHTPLTPRGFPSTMVALSDRSRAPGTTRAVSAPYVPVSRGMMDDESGQIDPTLTTERFAQRSEIYGKLMEYISPEAKEPKANLLDLVHVESDIDT